MKNQVASIGSKANATYLVAGNSLEFFLPKFASKVGTGQEHNLGMVITKEIGQPTLAAWMDNPRAEYLL